MTADGYDALVLHGLRLSGMATPETVASVYGIDPEVVVATLERLGIAGFVAPARGDSARWTLTGPGRDHGEALLARQLDDGSGIREVVTDAYDHFIKLNQPMLDVCTRWQLISREPPVLNDHTDPAYDAAVVGDLHRIDRQVQPICAELGGALDRFARYGQAFAEALQRLDQGQSEWLTKPTVMSYHTVWFQLHEDLLATLGLDRATETARLHGSSNAGPTNPTTPIH